jgi:signal transduction histidine kinase
VGQCIRGSLRAKFIVLIVALILALMGAVTLVVERHQRRAIFEQTRLRALALGASLAAVSEGYLLSYDFIQLEQIAENVTVNNADVLYAVAHLRDGNVAAFSRRGDLQGKRLDDPVSQQALQATAPLVQDILLPDSREPGYDVAIPVYGPRDSQKWGTVRVGFSLQRAYALIHQTQHDFFWLSLAAMGCGTLLAAVLAMRISQPIGQLVAAVHAFTRGAYDRPIRTGASDEIGYLARAFEQMRASLQRYLTSLTQHEAALQRKVDETRTLYEIGQEITAQVALEPTLDLIVERARELSHAESSLLALRQGASDTFAFQAYSGTVPETLASVDFGPVEGFSGCTTLTASPITVNDDLRAYPASPFLEAIAKMGVQSVIAVPLKARGTVIGVLAVTSQAAHHFHAEDQQLLSALADQAAIAIENAKLYEQVRQYAGELEATVAVRTQELLEANQQLAAASGHKSAFLANVSHELRTPLTAIKGSVDNMLDGLTGTVNDKQRRYLTRIQANTARLSRLINDLLDLSRIEAGKSDLQPTRLPVVALTHEVVEHLWPMAAEKHIRLGVAAADASLTAWADREKVTQVLMNLMGNAIKFTPSHGTVTVAIHRSGDAWVQISVTDTGPGIPADEATHIFDQFYQIATEGRQKTTGTGLGLAIAKSLVEMHGGQLWVESDVGRGSTFAFTLPVQQPRSLEVATQA